MVKSIEMNLIKKTGFPLPAVVWSDGFKFWYKEGVLVNTFVPYSPQLDEVQDYDDILIF